jgi:hypothetical protein
MGQIASNLRPNGTEFGPNGTMSSQGVSSQHFLVRTDSPIGTWELVDKFGLPTPRASSYGLAVVLKFARTATATAVTGPLVLLHGGRLGVPRHYSAVQACFWQLHALQVATSSNA